jgi:hypothetical protein
MARIKAGIIVLFSLACLFVFHSAHATGLSGTYTICSAGCDYSSFKSAFQALKSNGVSGPVTFNIKAGVYPETDTLLSFSGSSSANTVTFNGAGKDSTVMAGQGDWVLYVESVKYVNFKNIKFDSTANYNTLVVVNSDHITIENCAIIAPTLNRASNIGLGTVNYLEFKNNTITGGSNSLILGSSSPNYSNSYNVFENNIFSNFCKSAILTTGSGIISNNTYRNNTFNYPTCINSVGINSTNEISAAITGNRFFNCGLTISSPSGTFAAPFQLVNNFIIPKNDMYAGGIGIGKAGSNFLMANNTIYEPKNFQTESGVSISTAADSRNVRVVNNIFDLENGNSYVNVSYSGSFQEINGNDYYFSDKGKLSVYLLGKGYSKFSDLIYQSAKTGYESYASNIKPSYTGTLDLHLDKDSIAPVGVYADVATDIDGDSRCMIDPTAGADEVPDNSINAPKAIITGPDSIFNSVETVFGDSAKSKFYTTHRWYLDGRYITDSLFLKTALVATPSVRVSLVVANCEGHDSITRVFKVYDAAAAPQTDFKADKISIKTYDTLSLTDISTNHPSRWKWQVLPSFVYRNGVKRLTYKYVNSNDSSRDPELKFYFPGSYSVCLSSWNIVTGGSLRKGTLMCKTAYIQVNPVTPTLIADKPDTTFEQVNKASKAFIDPPKVLVSLDSFRNTLPDTVVPSQIAVNKLDTVKVMYSTTDSKGNRNVLYRWIIIYDTIAPVLTLKGKQYDTIAINQTYTDEGYTVTENYYAGVNVNRSGSFFSRFPSGKAVAAGIFRIIYTAIDSSGNKAVKTRYIIVKDTTRPLIKLNGANPDEVEVYDTYTDPGATATSKWFTGVSISRSGTFYSTFKNGIPIYLGNYTITYAAKDSLGNVAVPVTRQVKVVDTIPPVVLLAGMTSASVCQGKDYYDDGFQVTDNYWNGFGVDTEGTFLIHKTDSTGIYTWRYKITDGSGNVGYSAVRYILVRPSTDEACKDGIRQTTYIDAGVHIFPNPSSGKLFITSQLDGKIPVCITVTDNIGKVIKRCSARLSEGNPVELNLENCASGIYFVNISTADAVVNKKIVIAR